MISVTFLSIVKTYVGLPHSCFGLGFNYIPTNSGRAGKAGLELLCTSDSIPAIRKVMGNACFNATSASKQIRGNAQ